MPYNKVDLSAVSGMGCLRQVGATASPLHNFLHETALSDQAKVRSSSFSGIISLAIAELVMSLHRRALDCGVSCRGDQARAQLAPVTLPGPGWGTSLLGIKRIG
ncbi:hypothetical protein KXD40_003567 [Peronospora effusa]|uniref:Uncharacterized protein n=1 Tax=Peronospora effusa TaxID=542832 RepID=A0A3M6VMZ3_9STRA|nr:hypothetical protein DD238_008306 [Peronospora effusa]RQM09327.1 hypothetical protein DD237_007835 [Peronospora effusa]UIZ23098.1 hypothetical protein KXD40_003567 [Peronospora effusa]